MEPAVDLVVALPTAAAEATARLLADAGLQVRQHQQEGGGSFLLLLSPLGLLQSYSSDAGFGSCGECCRLSASDQRHPLLAHQQQQERQRLHGMLAANAVVRKQLPSIRRLLGGAGDLEVYPLHSEAERRQLAVRWNRPLSQFNRQPLQELRDYFGDKVAMYFAWLAFYNAWLLPLAAAGLACFVYGVATMPDDPVANSVCQGSAAQLTMCPLCDAGCPYWRLGDSCLHSCLLRVFDNPATVAFAVAASLWSSLFVQIWRRRERKMLAEWRVSADWVAERSAMECSLHHTHGKAADVGCRARTRRAVYYIPSAVSVLFLLTLAVAAVVGIIVYRVLMNAVFASMPDRFAASNAKLLTALTAGVLNFLCLTLLNAAYRAVAVRLTRLERHRLEADFVDSYAFKVYCLEFVNSYSALLYIAFLKGRLHGRPGEYGRLFNAERLEECEPAGCMVELVIQMLCIFGLRQLLGGLSEMLGLKLATAMRSRAQRMSGQPPPHVRDFWLRPADHLQLVDEFLEMVVQFGFVAVFAAAMPLGPALALLNNLLEMRLDRLKMLRLLRRHLPRPAAGIGVWLSILSFLSLASAVSNAAVVAFTSEQLPRLVYWLTAEQPDLGDYIRWRLSLFDTGDFEPESLKLLSGNASFCFYRDFRHPAGHELQYQFTTAFWHVLAARFAFVVAFQNLVLLFKLLIHLLLPTLPATVERNLQARTEAAWEQILMASVQEDEKTL